MTHCVDRNLSSHCCHHAKDFLGLEGFYIESAWEVADPEARDYLVHCLADSRGRINPPPPAEVKAVAVEALRKALF